MKRLLINYVLIGIGLVLLLTGCTKEETLSQNSLSVKKSDTISISVVHEKDTVPQMCPGNIVKDIDGNVYHTITIGNQVWLKENLKTTRLNNGKLIPHIKDSDAWAAIASPAFCWNHNNAKTYKSYGALYNWYVINTGKLCPKGWHVPTQEEWMTLINYLGGEKAAYISLKESGNSHWRDANIGTNSSGFTAIPAGGRYSDGRFFDRDFSCWWSSTEASETSAPFFYLHFNIPYVINYAFDKKFGFSVRCIKNKK